MLKTRHQLRAGLGPDCVWWTNFGPKAQTDWSGFARSFKANSADTTNNWPTRRLYNFYRSTLMFNTTTLWLFCLQVLCWKINESRSESKHQNTTLQTFERLQWCRVMEIFCWTHTPQTPDVQVLIPVYFRRLCDDSGGVTTFRVM